MSFMLSVANTPIMLIVRLSVIMLSVVMLNVVAHTCLLFRNERGNRVSEESFGKKLKKKLFFQNLQISFIMIALFCLFLSPCVSGGI
jgi:hypothetical protein